MIVIDETGGETSAEEDKLEHGTTLDQPDEPIIPPAIAMAKKGPAAAAGSDAEVLRIRVAPTPTELNVTCRRKTQPAKPFVPVRKAAAVEQLRPACRRKNGTSQEDDCRWHRRCLLRRSKLIQDYPALP